MSEVNWAELEEQYSVTQNCSTEQIWSQSLRRLPSKAERRQAAKTERKRRDISKAFTAVSSVYAANPNLTRDQMEKEVYKLVLPSVGAWLLGILVSTVIRMAITWALNRLFNQDTDPNVGVSLSSK